MSRLVRPAFVLLLLVTVGGCASIGVDPPELTLVDLRLEDVTLLESSGTVTVRLANTNPDPLVLDGMAFDLRLGGKRIGKALSDERIEVPRLSTATVDAELHVSHLAVAGLVQKTLESQSIRYVLSGKVYVLGEFGRRALRIERTGDFDFEGAFSSRLGNELLDSAAEDEGEDGDEDGENGP